MKIVVTGALGHIGSKFLSSIPKHYDDAEIILLDDLSAQRYVSIFALPDGARYRFFECDVSNPETNLLPFLERTDVVIHLAAITNAAGSFENKEKVEAVNFKATQKVAEACALFKIPMFYISSTSVYGTQADKVDENCSRDELQPQSPYAETKLKEEALLKELGESKGLKFIACRFGTIFGASPGMRFHTAVNKFCWQATLGIPVTVWRTALHQVRPYLDLADAISAINFIIDKQHFDNQIYNVLTLNATVDEILNVVRQKIPDLKVNFVDTKIMNQLSYHVLNEKFINLGFKFNGNLQIGIFEILELLKHVRSSPVKN